MRTDLNMVARMWFEGVGIHDFPGLTVLVRHEHYLFAVDLYRTLNGLERGSLWKRGPTWPCRCCRYMDERGHAQNQGKSKCNCQNLFHNGKPPCTRTCVFESLPNLSHPIR